VTKENIVRRVAEIGVVGAGGGGFPTHVKLSAKAQTVILNAAECEPLLHKDKEVLRAYTDLVLQGMRLAMQAVGAGEGVIGIKGKYGELIELLESKLNGSIRLVPLTDTYPAGDEFVLVYDVLGKVIPPGGLPLHVGAVVINVETAYNIAAAVPVVDKFLTVGGAVVNPSTFRAPVGISYRQLIEACGGATCDDPHVLVGGAMMGYLADNLEQPVTKTCGGLIVLPADHWLIQRRKWSKKQINQIGRSACDQCSYCTELCPRYLLGHPIEPHKAMRSLEFTLMGEVNVIGTQFCCECNLCSLYSCPENLDPKNVCTFAKRELMQQGKKWKVDADPSRPRNLLSFRRAPIKKLMRKIGLWQYTNVGPLVQRSLTTPRAVLPLKQHAGAPAEPIVAAGDRVERGQLIADMPDGKLGAKIHASLTGTVEAVNDTEIIIRA